MKWVRNGVWLRVLVTAAISIAMGGEFANGEESQWKLKLSFFSGVMERVSGDWKRLDERVFLQGNGDVAPTVLLFGRNEWVNYRLRMRARITRGTGGLLLFFRYREESWSLWWSLSGQEGIPSGIGQNRWNYGEIIPDTAVPQSIEKGKWYEISLVVRGREVKGYVDGNVGMEYTLPDDGTHASGKLGLGTWKAVAEFELLEMELFEAEVIPAPPSLRGRVLVKGMEEVPVPEAEIRGPFGTVNADHQGQFFVQELIPGRNSITITAPGFVTQRAIVSLEEGENIKSFYLRSRIPIDGGKILFFREYDRVWGMPMGDLFLLHLGSGVERKITQRPGAYFSPRWSPDGSMIAFYTLDSREIFVIPAEGFEMKKIAPGISPHWSPDGQRLLFVDGGRLWSFRADGAEPLLLFESPTYIRDYSCSPEGNRVLFESQSHIYVVNADGGELRDVAYPGGNPIWSPDGKTILFISPRGLMRVDIEDGKEIEIAPPGRFEDLKWSPDGSLISYRRWDEDQGGIRRPVLYLIEADGGERYRTFHFIKEGIQEYRWSPWGNELVLLTGREPPMPNTIYRMEVEGKKVSPLIDFPATNLQWSPNGEWISFLSQREAGWDIYTIKGDGTGLKKVTDTPETEFQESWCPNLH
ncbi:MAG: PD40 domain-containing protein [Syntrophobacterales bacterium]|nr:MAG: PD40 domain-containing protein [Syntrophobacterales bacterium]